MAATTLSDYTIIAKLIEGYVQANFTHKASLITSGIVGTIPDDNLSHGMTWDARGRIQYHTRWQVPTAATDLTVNPLATWRETGVVQNAADAFGFEDFARVAAGDENALAAAGEIVLDSVRYNTEVTFLTYLLPGMFLSGGPLSTADTYMIQTGTAFETGGANVAQARKLHGANGSNLSILLMHPDVYYNAEINRVADNLDYDTIQRFNMMGLMYGGMFNGAIIILNDLVYNDSGTKTYHTYLCRPGSLLLGHQTSFGVVAFRDELLAAGTDIIKYKLGYCAHVPGVRFSGSVPTVIGGATDAALLLGTNWTRRTSIGASEIGIVAIETVEA